MPARTYVRRPRSIRTRLMVWNGLAVAAIVVILGAIVLYTVQTYLMRSVDTEMAHRADFITHARPPRREPRPWESRGPQDRGREGNEFLDRGGHSANGAQADGAGNGIFSRQPSSAVPGLNSGPYGGLLRPNGPPSDDRSRMWGGGGPRGERGRSPEDLFRNTPDNPTEMNPLNRFIRPTGPPGNAVAQIYPPLIMDQKGQVILPSSRKSAWDDAAYRKALKGEGSYSTVQIGDDRVRVLSTPLHDPDSQEGVIGVAQIAYPLTEVQHALNELRRVMLWLIPIALLLAGLGGAAITGRALRPVGSITATAARIGGEDLSRRLAVTGDDEFGRLAATFNEMLGRLETTFNQREALVHELESLVEQQRRFTADASHELRTPLTVIKANTSLTLRDKSVPAVYRETLEDIDSAVDTMERLVQDLLLLARSDEGRLGHDSTAVPAAEILREAAGRIRHADSAPIEVQSDPGAGAVLGNRDELIRLFSNLIENASRHTPSDGRITISARADDGHVIVVVRDTGSGIAPEHLPHICERFYRVEASRVRSGGGAGLGLSICKGIVEAHGGAIAFASDLGKGTSVTVSLPRA